MARKILEIFKDVLIVVLALAIVVLTLLALPARTITSTPWLAAILRPVAPLFGLSQSELTYSGDVVADEVHGAAQPIAITVQNTAGRMSAQYDFAALDNAFEQLGGYLAQALDSAQGGRAVSQRELLAAFAEQGAAFCYPSALNPSLAAAWLNVDAPELPDAQWFLLAVEDGGVSLYLAGTESYRCETAVSAAALEAALDRSKGIAAIPEVGEIYTGKIRSIVAFGAFVEIMPGKDGLLHISEIGNKRYETMEETGLKEGDTIEVKLIGLDPKNGKLKLSRKVLLPGGEKSEEKGEGRPERREGHHAHRREERK